MVLSALDKGKEIGKNEVIKDVLDWLDKNFYNNIDMYSDYSFDITGLNSDFSSKEQMLQSFKKLFNIENIE
jgi:hypothetical protein